MSQAVAGIYRNGVVELDQRPAVRDDTPALVTFLPTDGNEGNRVLAEIAQDTSFWDDPPSIEELAARQGVKPCRRIEDLRGDCWPEDESVDEFIAAVRRWRQEGSTREVPE